nr:MAG: ORF1 [Torque teno midi virus]
MPFYWRRRRRYFNPYWRYKSRRRKTYRRRQRRPRRRRARRFGRRRRRRRRAKVRRKKTKIPIQQWQPDSIKKCKIRGLGILVMGAEGTQMYCYTTEKNKYVPPKYPYGGGFGAETYTLKYLYEQYSMHNNIWTASNIEKDLCRFLWCKFTFYRHTDTDFIVYYNRTLPEQFTKYTFPAIHPHQALLQKHHKVILSKASKPLGKYKVTMKIKPPRQMLSKWFFTKPFSKFPLVAIKGTACSFRYAHLSATNQNLLVSLYSINPKFYQNSDWDQAKTEPYEPYHNISYPVEYQIRTKEGALIKKTLFQNKPTAQEAIKITGWFSPQLLQAVDVLGKGTIQAIKPMLLGRYNPVKDDGVGNQVYIVSTVSDTWNPPTHDKDLIIQGLPLWLAIFGLPSYLKTMKPADDFFTTHICVIKSKYIYCYPQIGGCDRYCPIDFDYVTGKKSWDQPLLDSDKGHWTPNLTWQLKTLNAIAESGPYMPKYSEEKNSTWELKYTYEFFFKWGGPHGPDATVKDPQELPTFDVPDTVFQRIQIRNPEKQDPETILHPWDYRRGYITQTAIKRMCDNQSTDTEFEPITDTEPPKKKARQGAAYQNPYQETQEIQSCLHSLCEENIYQETPQNLEQLIHQQQRQQQQLRYSILKLLMDLKQQQRHLQLQTGLLS